MKPFSFVLGTDITQLSRWTTRRTPKHITTLARRILTTTEYEHFIQKFTDPTDKLEYAPCSHSTQENRQVQKSPNDLVSKRVDLDTPPALDLAKNTDLNFEFRRARFLASRFAAKEAAKKAWGATLVSWKDVSIHTLPGGERPGEEGGAVEVVLQPYELSSLKSRPQANSDDSDEPLIQRGQLSISHDGDYAVATVIAYPLKEDIRQMLLERWKSQAQSEDASQNTTAQSDQSFRKTEMNYDSIRKGS